MSSEHVYPSFARQDRNRGITRLDQSADRIAASMAGSVAFAAAPSPLIARSAYTLAEALIAEGDQRKEAV